MENNQKLLDQLQESIDLHYKQIETMKQMRRLVMLSSIMDMPLKEITGKVSVVVHTYGAPPYARPWRTEELVIKLDGEEVVRKKLLDVPLDLWPEDIRAEYERQERRNKRKETH
jgi:hypothetical protein